MNSTDSGQPVTDPKEDSATLLLQITPDLYRAFQRCSWVLVTEAGRSRQEIANEAIRDFLIKHGC